MGKAESSRVNFLLPSLPRTINIDFKEINTMFDPSHQPLDSHAGAGAAQTDTKELTIAREGDELRSLLEKEDIVRSLFPRHFIPLSASLILPEARIDDSLSF